MEVELPLALRARFYAISIARHMEAIKPQARAWLSERGLLDRLPSYRPGTIGELAFARSLEQLCGPDASGALDAAENGHSFSRAWVIRQKPDEPNDASTCLFNAALVSNFPLGFIGNEAEKP